MALRRPSRRQRLPTRWFASRDALGRAVAERVRALQQAGRPVLVGAESVDDAEALSAALRAAAVAHALLDARNDANEASIVAAAGTGAAVTVATQMAGRGTDIALAAGVAARGGLHIIGCQLNAARRIDRQLAGRAARQGDPGSVEVWLSLDNALLRWRLPRPIRALLQRHAERLPSGVCRALGHAVQRLQERRDAVQRRALLENDRRLDRQLSFAGR